MNPIDLLDRAVAAAPPVRSAKFIAIAIAALLAIGAIGFAGWWLFVRPRAAQVAAATARVAEATATGTAGAATDTLHLVVDNKRTIDAIDALTRTNQDAIHSSAGASAALDPALGRAGLAALCLRGAYRLDPVCLALRGDGGSGGAARADSGGGAPGE